MAGKLDYAGIIWLRCPSCSELFYIESYFFKPEFATVKVHCPFCSSDFAKEDATDMWKPGDAA